MDGADVNSLGDFHGYEPIFCEKRGRAPIRIFNHCHALCVRVHVPFSNISPFQISILGSSWNINKEVRRLIETPPDQVTRISRFQLCHSVRHFQIEVHLHLRMHFKCLPEFLLKDLELH